MFVVGLTGGIGSGKSTVSAHLQHLGAAIIDTDVIAHRLTAPAGRALPALAKLFPDCMHQDGSLDRARLRARVFTRAEDKARLESLLHPLIGEEVEHELRQPELAEAAYTVLVVPLLFESGRLLPLCHTVVAVDADPESQIARVCQTRGLDRAEVERILGQQLSCEERNRRAQFVLRNDASLDALGSKTRDLHQALAASAACS